MGEEPQIPGEWDPASSGEPPAQLLRRAISHVESLLHRLEPNADAASAADAAPVEQSPPLAAPPSGPDRFTPLASVSSAAQADALRVTLHAHEKAHRLQSEANAVRAIAAADGERMLLEARAMSDCLHVEARDSATELLAAAQRESLTLLDAARAEAASIRQGAVAEQDARRAEYDALTAQERAAVLDEAEVVLRQAEHEAERIRDEAREAGRADAARLAQQQVSGAVADVRRTMQTMIDQLRESLAEFDASVDAIEVEPAQVDPPSVPELHAIDRPGNARRPLGLLFGAQR